MTKTTIAAIENTIQKTEEWLDELTEIGHFTGPQQAYSVLHAVLHALRDVLPVQEGVQFAAGMPMLVRGLYFEGWNPAKVPVPSRDRNEFLGRVTKGFRAPKVDPLHASRSVFALLRNKTDPGEFDDVCRVLHHSLRELLEG